MRRLPTTHFVRPYTGVVSLEVIVMSIKCSSCHINLLSEEEFTQFNCPSCMSKIITRCKTCRKKSNMYNCDCGFEGP
ncbi:MAG TPA: zinc finger domain-containing protein [archaeon]|nr:zinc finger domain-containing protein [archaeon]